MNKLCYRIVFNKARGLCMVVQEGARSQGKGAGQAGPAGSAAMNEWQGGLATRLRSLALAMLGAFGGSVLLAGLASAQIIADPNAAGRQQATVLNAANGVLQVNVQTPSAAGVSRNVYSRFDVPKTGAVLNNSRTAVQSQLGGWIDANPWMAQGTARVILNEVNSKDPSQLRGYMEIAGSRAEMVIANPAGIVVDGAGFINVSRATLTTGKPLLGEADGALRGYAVRGGMISIEGAGMDARQTDYAALIARSVQLNAGLWAQQLEVTAGANDVALAADGAAPGNVATPVAGSGEAPRYGIDTSLLGGMYANKITLVGTEAGVGVRNAGAIGAAAGELVVTSEGRLENTGSLAASLALSAKARDGVVNSGTISAKDGLQLAADTLSNSNLISSSGRVVLAMQGDVDNSHGVIQAQSLALSSVAGGVNNQSGKLLQSGAVTLDVTAASLHNAGGGQVGAPPASAGADGSGNAGAGTGTGTGADGGASAGNAGANTGNGNGNNGGTGTGTGTDAGGANTGVTPPAPIAPGFVRVAGAINNDGGQILSAGGIALSVAALDNAASQMNLSSLAVNGGAFNNRAGQLNVQRGASIHGASFDNHAGKLVAGGKVDVQVQSMDNGSGSMSAGGDLLLDSGAIVNRDGKLVSGARAAIASSGAVDNHNGQIQAVTGLALDASGKLDNQSGAIEAIGAAAAMQVRAGEIDNTKGRIVNTGSGASEVGAAGKLLNTGVIGANGALSIAAQTMTNRNGGTVQAAGGLALAVSKQLDNQGSITSGAKLNFDESGATLNNAGQMAAGGDIHIAVLHAANDGGQIGTAAASGASLALSAADISNRGGSLLADRDIGISASQGDLDNNKGVIHGQRDAAVNAAQTLLNQGGLIETVSAGSKLSLDTGAIQNQGGRIVNAGSGDSTVAAAGAIVSDGLIAGNGKLALTAATVSNSGTLSSGGAFNLAVSQQLDNAGLVSSAGALDLGTAKADMRNTGQMVAAGDINVLAHNVANAGQIATTTGSGGGITLHGAALDNHGGGIAASGAVDIQLDGALNNSSGTVQAGRDLTIAAKDTLNNSAGIIEAMSSTSRMQLNAGAIVNAGGRIANVGSGDTGITAGGDIQNTGVIAGNGDVKVTAYTVHNGQGGALTSGKDMTLAVEQLLQNDGSIQSGASLVFSKTTSNVGNSGSIIADGGLVIKAGNLVNDRGQIATTQASGGDISIESQQLGNRNGRILAAGSADLQVGGAVDNRIGVIQGAQNLTLNAGGVLNNRDGAVEALGADGRLSVQAYGIDNTDGSIVGAGRNGASISSASYIWNGGRIAASDKLDLNAVSVSNSSGASILAGAGLGLSVRDLLDNHGTVSSNGLMNFGLTTAVVNNDAQIVSNGGINLAAGVLNNDKGQISTVKLSQSDLNITAGSASNQGGAIVADRNATLTVGGALNNTSGGIQAGKDLQATAGAALNNTKGVMEAVGAASALKVQAGSIDNTDGRIVNVGSGASSVAAQGAILNGGQIAGNGDLTVAAKTLQNNAAATITAGKNLALGVTQQLDNLGAISSTGKLDFTQATVAVRNGGSIVAGSTATINAGAFNNDGGQLATVRGSGADIALNAQSLSNRGGVIQSDRNVTIGVAYAADNTHGSIQAKQDLQFAAGAALNNNSGVMEAISATGALRVLAASIDNSAGRIVNVGSAAATVTAQGAVINSGLIAGNGSLDLAAGSLQNQAAGKVSSGLAMDLAVTQQLDNQGTITSGGTLEFSQTTAVVNNSGQIVSAGPAHVAAGVLNNDGGQIATLKDSGSSIAIDSRSMSNQGGSVLASGDATLAVAGAVNNAHGTIQAQRDLKLTAGGALNNASGVIEAVTAASSLTLQASAIDNSAGRVVNVGTGAATVSAQGLVTNSGLIAGNGSLDLAAGSLRNLTGGSVLSGQRMGLDVVQQLDNQGVVNSGGTLTFNQATAIVNNSGQIVSAGLATIAAGSLNNDGGQIATLKDSGSSIAIDSQSMSNQGGSVLASGDATLAVAGAVNNAHGTIQAQRDLKLTAGGALNNASGVIEAVTAASSLTLQANAIDNSAGRVVNVGTGAATVSAQGLVTNSGLIAGNGSLDLAAGSLRNLGGGSVLSGQRMGLDVVQQLDNQGVVNSGGTLTFNQATAIVNNSGQITSAGQATIAAGSLNNDGGLIATLPNSNAGIVIASLSLSNHGGRVQASGDAAFNVGGALDNAQGTLQAGQDMRLAAGGTLSNNAGVIEALAAGSTMQVQAGAIVNGSGRIVNVGTAATSIGAQGGISSSGTIAGNGTLDLSAQSLQNSGTVSSARSMSLSLSQLLDNRGAINSGGTLDSLQTIAQITNSGTMTAAGRIGFSADNLNNDGGQIATLSNSGADIRLDSQTMSNRSGSVLASGNAGVNVYGALDNAHGTLQAGRDMQVSAGGALGNASGVIEALSGGGTLAVQGQSIDNTAGRIVNVGSGDTGISSLSSIVSSGMIAGNGNLLLSAQSAQNRAGGTIAAGGNMELAVTQQMQNQGTVSSAGTLGFTQTGASFSNSGQMIAGGTATFNAASFNNDGGQIATTSASGADISVASQSISNRGGKILASGDTTLSSGADLDNGSGTLQAGKSLKLGAVGALGNTGGTIEADGAAGTLDLTAATVDSSGGRIVNVGIGDTNVLIGSDLVNSGLIAANGNLNLSAHTLKNNAGGSIGAAGKLLLAVDQQVDNHAAITSTGTLTFVQAGANLNNDGKIVAGGAMTIVAKAVNNNDGQIATAKSGGADLTLTAASLSNEKGQILADGKAALAIAGALDNVQGTIQAGKDLQINAGGALTNNGGAIEAAGATSALTLKALSIDNGSGRIVNVGSGDTSITSVGAVSNAGAIAGGGNLLLSAVSLQNSGTGIVASGKNMTLQVAQLLDNQGTINSSGTLTFNQAGANLNNSGLIISGGNALIVANQINNNGGRIGTGAGSDGDLSLTAQQLSNEAGHITTGRDLAVITHVLQGNGELQGGRDLSLSMDGDYTQGSGTQQFHSNRDLSLTVTGNIVNNATFEAAGKLTLSGNNVSNNAGAVMQGQGVAVNAAGNLTNAGQINGSATVDLKSGATIDNTNAIVGGNLSLAAQNLNNTGASTLLGSTGTMALGVAGTVNNTGGASIYSGGSLSIAGALGGGTTGLVNNMSSTIEAAGDLSLNAASVNNIRENVTLVKVQTVDETKQMSLPSWYHHGDNHNNYDPNSSNYVPSELYYVNPADILEDKIMFAPDGNAYGRAVIRTHANDSAFFWAASGAYSAQGERLRMSVSEGTRELYYMVRRDNMANPDQGGSTDTPNFLYLSAVNSWHSGPIAYSSQYGNCSSNCVLFETQPQYNDPTSEIIRVTARAVAPQSGKLEQSRLAHHTAEEDQIAPGSGAVAQILSGGNMRLTVGQALTNQYGQIMATGGLVIDGGAAISNQGATLYRNHTFDGTWKTDDGQVVAYTMPSQSEVIGSAAGVISGGKGVSITGRSFSNVDITAGTVGNIRDSVTVLATGNNSASGASHATGNGASGGSAGGHVGGSGIGNNAGGASVAGGSGISNQAAHGAQAGGSGVGNNAALGAPAGGSGVGNHAALGAQAGDSGLSNQTADAALAGGSGLGNQAHTRLDTSGSGAYNGARDIDNINASGKASTAATSGPAKGSGASGKALGDVNSGHGASLAQNAAASGSVVKVAPNGLSLLNPNANGSYVFETRPQFANHGNWISSDYLLKALDTDPAVTQKRLGDGFYEQRMVRDQLNQLTGRAPTGGQNDDSRYKDLMTSGISFAQQYDLRLGIALSADQISHLTSDIVWMETQTVSLPDGTVENVLVPKVYLAHAGGDAVKANGALVTGDGVSIKTSDSIVNRGGLIDGANGRTVLVAGQDIVNQGGAIKGGAMDLSAGRDVINQSLTVKQEYASVNTSGSYTTLSNQASITASGALAIKAGRDVSDTGGTIAGASVGIGAARDVSFNALQTGSTYASQVSGFTEKDSSTTYKVGQVASSGDLKMVAGQDIKLSGTQVAIGAAGNGTLVAGRDVSVAAVVNEFNLSKQNDPGSKHYDKEVRQEQNVVGASVAAGGSLTVKAGDSGLGSLAIAGSNLSGGGKVQLVASGDVSITQVQETHLSDLAHHDESSSMFKKSSNTSADYSKIDKVVGSSVSGDSVVVKSGNDIVVNGSQLSATQALTVDAGRDLLVSSAQQGDSEKHSEQHQSSGFSFNVASGGLGYSKSEQAKAGNSDTVTQVGSVLSGGSVSASSGRDTTIKGSTVVADHDIVIDAKRDLSIVSAENSSDGASSSSSKKSGSIGTTFQPAIGTVKNASDGTSSSVTQVGSQIASLGGNVSLKAGEQYTQTSSEVTAPKGDISIDAKDVLINAAMNSSDSSDHTTYSKTAIGGTVSVPIVDALKSANSMVNAAKNTSDSRMQALAAMNAANSLNDAYKAYTAVQDAGIKVSISLSNQKSDSTVVRTSDTAAGSSVSAGGSVTINATGAGKDSNLTAIGSDIKAGKDVNLSADNEVNLLAAKGTASQHSTNSSSGSSIGIGFGIGGTSNGFTIDLAVSQARGKADGDDIGYTNSHVTAGSQVNLNSGGDTTLKGGVISAPTVVADIGGNLNIESLQDSSKFNSKQSSSGLNASLCIPPACYGASTVGGSISKSHVNGDFLSVLEQSGIKAGDGGFQVAVNGNTDLKAGLLSSSQAAVDQGKNVLVTGSLTTSDLKNKDHYDAGGFALSGSVSGKLGDQTIPSDKKLTEDQKKMAAADGKPSASGGFGSASGDQSSTTASGISGGLIAIKDQAKQLATGKDATTVVTGVDREVTTESAAAKADALTKGWDAQQLQKEVDTQVAITQEFSKQAPKVIAQYAGDQRDALKAQATQETDEVKKKFLLDEAGKWDEGGAYRVALHAVSGGLTGGLNGALGAGVVADSAKLLDQLQDKARDALVAQGVSPELAKAISQGLAETTALGIGAAVGGAVGGAASLATDTNNRQLHPDERQWAKENAKKYQKYLLDKTGDSISAEDAYQRLLSAGYAVVDNAAQTGGKSDIFALQYLSENKSSGLFIATAAERANPFLNGNADNSWTPEMAARFGPKTPGEAASRAVTKAVEFLGKPCSNNCAAKFDAISDAVNALEKAAVLYQDDLGSVKIIKQQIIELVSGITKEELVRGAIQSVSNTDKSLALMILGNPSKMLAGSSVAESISAVSLVQQIKELRLQLPSSARTGGNMGIAQIDIPGLPNQMVASSRIDVPTAKQLELGFVGKTTETFASTSVPNVAGELIHRGPDSEAKILNNIAEKLGENTSAKGSVTLLTEREPCTSCSNIIEKFQAKYPNISLKIMDNNGVVLNPPKKGK